MTTSERSSYRSRWIGRAFESPNLGYRYLSRADKLRIVQRQAGVCALCPETFLSTDFQDADFDHIKPVSQGGEHTWENVQALCPECHRKKTNKEHANG